MNVWSPEAPIHDTGRPCFEPEIKHGYLTRGLFNFHHVNIKTNTCLSIFSLTKPWDKIRPREPQLVITRRMLTGLRVLLLLLRRRLFPAELAFLERAERQNFSRRGQNRRVVAPS